MTDKDSPVQKGFDCVAFQRAERERLGKELGAMGSEEIGLWMRNYRPEDAKLRVLVDRLLDRTAEMRQSSSTDD